MSINEKASPTTSSVAGDSEKGVIPDVGHGEFGPANAIAEENDFDVFQKTNDGVDFRTVGWPRASIIFLKILFATGVLSIPAAMYSVGAVGGALLIVGWGLLNTYAGIIQGDFRNTHAKCHTVADMAGYLGGTVMKEAVGGLYLIAYVLCSGAGILGVSIGLNALSDHAICTAWWSFIATIVVATTASVRTFQNIGWLTWAGFVSIYIAVFIVVIGVTTLDRPAAAPATGPYELGYYAIASPTFAAGVVAASTIFVSSAGTSAFMPVIAEMRQPRDFRKALYTCMAFVTASYLAFALVVYRWCGQWVASPSLGSAGPVVKKVAFGIGLVGLIVSACLYCHVAAKYLFVRILRNSRHLQANTLVHWGTWLGCTFSLTAMAFVLAEAIPIFNYLVALTGSICFAPLALMLPGWLWLHDHGDWRQGNGVGRMIAYWLHWLMILLGAFFLVGGTYGVIVEIKAAYADGLIVRCDVGLTTPPCSNCSEGGQICKLRTRKRKSSRAQKPQPVAPVPDFGTSAGDHAITAKTLSSAPLLFVQSSPTRLESNPEDSTASHSSPDNFRNSSYLSRRAILADDFPDLDHSHGTILDQAFSLSQQEMDVLNLYRALDLPSLAVRQSLIDACVDRCWTWMPVLDPAQILAGFASNTSSLVLMQALLMVGSQMRRTASPEASTEDYYHRLKALIDIGYERQPVNLLASMCLIQWWTPVAPRDISTNTPRFWLCCAVGLAQQVGLHRKPRRNAEDKGLRRRIWWTLYARDCIVASAHGRPRIINPADCTVEKPTIHDFPHPEDLRAQIFVSYTAVSEILCDLCEVLNRQIEASMAQKNQIGLRLLNFMQVLPDAIRLQNVDGSSRPYNFDIAQLHVPLLTAITILFRPRSMFNLLAASTAAIVAANLNFRIFEAIELRDDTFSLSSAYAWYMFVTAVSQLSCLQVVGLGDEARHRLDRIEDVLRTLGAVRPSAANNLKNVQTLRKHFESTDITLATRPELNIHTRDDASLLFSPVDLFEIYGPEVVQSFHCTKATLASHQSQTIPHLNGLTTSARHTPRPLNEQFMDDRFSNEEPYDSFPELLGEGFGDNDWMRNWIDEIHLNNS